MRTIQQRIDELEQGDRKLAWIISTIFMVLLLLLMFLLTAFTHQLPRPGDQFVELAMADFGTSAEGKGDVETETPSEKVEEVVEEAVSNPTPVESVPTPEVPTQTESEISVPTSTETTEAQEIPEETPEPEPTASQSLLDALNNMNNSNSGGGGGDGNSETTGNEGNSDGNIDGKGVVGGNEGYSIDMGGRGMVGEPANVKPKQEGTVVLKIFVDSQGNIISSEPDYGRSSVPTAELFELAKEAIKTMKFVPKPGVPKQKGYITFNFKLK